MAVVVTTEPRGFNVYQSNESKRGLRSALLLGAASVAAMGFSVPASAQDSSTETVVVTGSRIPQQGLYSSSPVTAVGQQELKFEGTANVENLLNNLPGVFADYGQNASNGASGTATVNLRNLGSARTLVLVDGRRLMPGDPALPVADLNNIPAALVDHVEVLTGGASATYGSDALAGVVNFIMRKDFEGVELDGQWSIAQHDNNNGYLRNLQSSVGYATAPSSVWDGQTVDGTLILGTNTADGKGNITAYVGYRHSEPIVQNTRDVSACALDTNGALTNFRCAGSSNKNRWLSFDNLFGTSGYGTYDYYQTGTGTPGSGVFAPYGSIPAPTRTYNYAAVNYFQRPDERYTGGFFGHYEVSPLLNVYADFMFSDDHTVAQIAESGAFLASGPTYFPGTISPGYLQVNCENPLMTAQENQALCGGFTAAAINPATGNSYFADFGAGGPLGNGYDTFTGSYWDGAGNITPGQSLLWIGRRDFEGGKRQDDLRHTSYRMVLGAKGDLGGGWAYDLYAQYGITLYTETYKNEWSKQRVQNALQVDRATGQCTVTVLQIDPNCVPLDIFNGIGSANNTAGLGYVLAQGFKQGWTQEQVMSGSLTGDLGEWGVQSPWAKSPVALALGAEYRSEAIQLDTSRDFQTGDLYGQGAKTLPVPKSSFNVVETFGEVRVPLIQGMPLAEDLTLTGGYRYSSYSSVGAVRSWKYGAEWQIVDDVKLRGSFQRAVRAPNVLESFAPANVQLFGGSDPCSAAGGVTTGQCASVTNVGTGLLNCPAGQCNVQTAGNPNLKAETSDTKTWGIVFTPTFLDGFTATVDYFDIKVADYIGVVGPNQTLAGCYTSGDPVQEAFYCPLVHRGATGAIFGTGYVDAPNVNLPYLSTKGWDFETNYQTDLADLGLGDNGSIAANFVGTLLTQLDTLSSQFSSVLACEGLYGATCGTPSPKWRHKLRVTWSSPWDFDLSLNWRHIGSVNYDAGGVPAKLGGVIDSFDYIDLAANWAVSEGVSIRAGVNNVFDKDPPALSSGSAFPRSTPPFGNGNTYPQVYDALGRTIFIGGTIKY